MTKGIAVVILVLLLERIAVVTPLAAAPAQPSHGGHGTASDAQATAEQRAAAAKLIHVWTFGHPEGPFAQSLGRAGMQAPIEYAAQVR